MITKGLNILVSHLSLDRQHPVWYLNNKDPKTSCLHEIENQIFKKIQLSDWVVKKVRH